MKTLILILAAFIFTTVFVNAQTSNFNFCGTMPYLEKQKKDNPKLEAQMEQFEQQVQIWIKENYGSQKGKNKLQAGSGGIITIPVVVHILYCTDDQNVSDAQVFDQIAITNRDYAGQNPHSMGVFSEALKTNTGFQFALAKKTPDGKSTSGIERRKTTLPSFGINYNEMKYYAMGGLDAWDPKLYMNIWVCDLELYGGFAQFPSSYINETFGVVIRNTYFGSGGPVQGRNNGGATTHEIGHCFDLRHTWGDDQGACTGTDYCDDIPNAAFPTLGNYGGLVTDDCSLSNPGIMYMNFMDYSDDDNFANFTPNQNSRMQALFAPGGALVTLANSAACSEPTGCEAPTTLRTKFITKATVTVEWKAMTGALSYNIQYRKYGSSTWISTSSTTNSKQITGLTRNTSYEFQVQCVTASCTSAYSYIVLFKTPFSDPTSSLSATVLVAPANNEAGVILHPLMYWSPVSNATFYYLQLSEYSNFSEFSELKVYGSTATTLGGLLNGKSYYWRVKACNGGYSSAWSAVSMFATLAPTLPQSSLVSPLEAAVGVSTNPSLSWDPVVGATSYVLQYSSDNFTNFTEISTNLTSQDIDGLSDGVLYYWRVKGINGNEFSPWSQRHFITTYPTVSAPTLSYPENEATNISFDLTFNWSLVSGATYYVLEYSADATFSTLGGCIITTALSGTVKGLNINSVYFWRVRAFVSNPYRGYNSPWSDVFSFTTGDLSLSVPVLLSPANNSTNTATNPTLTWNSVNNATAYNVEYSVNSDMSGATQATVSTTSYSVNGLSAGTKYYWNVQAKNGDLLSDWSSVWNLTTSLPAPVLSSPANNATNVSTSPTLSWKTASGANSYNLQYSTSSTFNTKTELNNINAISKAISGLSKRTTYYWRVNAVYDGVASDWSAAWQFKTANNGKIVSDDGTELNPDFSIYPNPAENQIEINYTLSNSSSLSFLIYNSLGIEVGRIANGQILEPGNYNLNYDTSTFAPGIYYLAVKHGTETETKKFVVIR